MSLRFRHVFMGLMALCGLTAFVIPSRITLKATPNIQILFRPISWPAGAFGQWFSSRTGGETWTDRRDIDRVREENATLRAMTTNLAARLEQAEKRNAIWDQLGALRNAGLVVPVVGPDAGTRQTLQVRRVAAEQVKVGQYAIYPGGVVGMIDRAGVGGAQVRLITDGGFKMSGKFARLRKNASGQTELVKIATSTALIEGAGDNTLRVRQSLTMEEATRADLLKDPESLWAYVEDTDWPDALRGFAIAQVEKIGPNPMAPLFAEITLRPATNLLKLKEVLVVRE